MQGMIKFSSGFWRTLVEIVYRGIPPCLTLILTRVFTITFFCRSVSQSVSLSVSVSVCQSIFSQLVRRSSVSQLLSVNQSSDLVCLNFLFYQKFNCPTGQTCKVQYVPCVMPKCKDAIAINRPTCIKDPSGKLLLSRSALSSFFLQGRERMGGGIWCSVVRDINLKW